MKCQDIICSWQFSAVKGLLFVLLLLTTSSPLCRAFLHHQHRRSLKRPETSIDRHLRQQSHLIQTRAKEDDDVSVPTTEQMHEIALNWMQAFSDALTEKSEDVLLTLFIDDDMPFYWRDMVAFTWNIITLEGISQISDFVQNYQGTTANWKLDTNKQLTVTQHNLEFWGTFETEAGYGRAHVRLQNSGERWKAYTLLTTLYELKDRPFQIAPNHRPRGTRHGPIPNRHYYHEQHSEQVSDDGESYVVVIGGGQAGLALGARLELLEVPYVILESGTAPGSSWRNRYPSLCLHDPVYYNHMPYLPFPVTWPVFAPRDKIANWLEFYASALDLNVRCNSRVIAAVKDDNGRWKVQVAYRNPSTNQLSKYTIRAHHIVFATGNSSHPRIPAFPGKFGGIQVHSSQYAGGKDYRNCKHAVVIGANNSAFDIVQDLWEQGVASVTMIQRTPSMVVSTESVLKHGLGPLYSENAELHHEEADLVATTVPYKLALDKWKSVNALMRKTDKELHKGVTKAGYKLEYGPDGTGIFAKSATEGGGFYIDQGCAELLTRGDVSVQYGIVERFEEDAIVITNKNTGIEERIHADLIVYATGFGTMDQFVLEICGEDVAYAVGRTWGLGLGHKPKDPGPWEGELRNMWKPTTVDGLWFQGGNLAQNRHYSRFLALQLAARYMEIQTNVYGIPKPTPLALTEQL